ncbi:alpha/beta hydrolase [Caulobacter sp. BK020]|uniref:alpha/beta fold hydrolase n=1 Tax=Caulobacter sp. BK020 TaxID=2512117 RepID=UPI00104859B8|nr:alpha/beta hydrolase [Caulobacter sp. BK020]TCS14580.1 pimeloyl-ACP methyl ester carboxylesterase [Caulobacter sp. BK020]
MTQLAPPMPEPSFARINGIRMAYYEAGPRVGVPIVLCHGFPEFSYSWRWQIAALAAAGRWVIVPDQRGYGLTDRPEAVEDYDMDHLTGDLIGLLDHLGVEKAVFCGHDWGGLVVWQLPLMHPGRAAGIVGLNTPFLPRLPIDPITLFRNAFGEDMYIVHFQKPGVADAQLAADVERTMRYFMRKPTGVQAAFTSGETSSRSLALQDGLARYDVADESSQLLAPEELKVFVETFQRTGFTGGVNWYRNFVRNWERAEHLPTRIDGVPCLMIMAAHDVVLPPSLADRMGDQISDLEKVLVEGSGHWTQQEKPDEVNAILIDWLGRRFPNA